MLRPGADVPLSPLDTPLLFAPKDADWVGLGYCFTTSGMERRNVWKEISVFDKRG